MMPNFKEISINNIYDGKDLVSDGFYKKKLDQPDKKNKIERNQFSSVYGDESMIKNRHEAYFSSNTPFCPTKKDSFFRRKRIYVRNNIQSFAFGCLFAAINLTLAVQRVIQYRDTNLLHIGARACGQCLNFDCALLLALILRRTITRLRKSPLGNFFPCDRHIHYHKIAGWTVFALSVLHTFFHLANFIGMSAETGISLWSYMWDTSLQIGWIWGLANPSGIVLMILLALITAFSHRCVRKSGNFEVFYWTHLLSLPFWILLILHAPNFWKWLLIPGSIFVLENVIKLNQVCSSRGRTVVVSSYNFHSGVTKLVIRKPKDLEFRAGEYVYLNVPAVARFEWHPFTISSAPEEEDVFMVHIRAVGGWTNKVYELFNAINNPSGIQSPFSLFSLPERKMRKISIKGILPPSIYDPEKPPKDEKDVPNSRKNSKDTSHDISQGFETAIPSLKYSHERRSVRKAEENRFSPAEVNQSALESRSTTDTYKRWPSGASEGSSSLPVLILETPEGQKLQISEESSRLECPERAEGVDRFFEVYVDGPYGSPSSDIFKVSHAVLVGAGIGVTPFASVLQSVMHRYKEAKTVCPHCHVASCVSLPSSLKKLRKVDFIWVNRDLHHFEWFIELLANLEEEQLVPGTAMERFLNLHLYKTGNKPTEFPVPLASAIHEGRPDWDKLLQQIRESRVGKICVYYCGPPALAVILREKCLSYQLDFKKEMF